MSDINLPIASTLFDEVKGLLGQGPNPETLGLTLVQLLRLECIKKEDFGDDEPDLTVYVDELFEGVEGVQTGALQTVLGLLPGIVGVLLPSSIGAGGLRFTPPNGMDENDDFPLTAILPLLPGRSFRVKLMEIDDPDADDHIDTVTVSLHSSPGYLKQKPNHLAGGIDVPTKTIILTGDDAYYEIPCKVIQIALSKEPDGDGPGVIDLGDVLKGKTPVDLGDPLHVLRTGVLNGITNPVLTSIPLRLPLHR